MQRHSQRTSVRRQIGDIVLVKTDDEEFIGQIDARGAEQQGICSTCYVDATHDPQCREWPNVNILTNDLKPTGEVAYHISECDMYDKP